MSNFAGPYKCILLVRGQSVHLALDEATSLDSLLRAGFDGDTNIIMLRAI